MAAQWLDELLENGIAYGSEVVFSLPTETKLDMVKGRWRYVTVKSQEYKGMVTRLHQHQLAVEVAGIGVCLVHPSMVKPVNVSALLLKDVR